jgi:UDP-N-acetylmuramoyl-tripeptide--D-alanyl-D-alanine ligase
MLKTMTALTFQATRAVRLDGSRPVRFDAVCLDTRHMQRGSLFVALAGERFDAHAFLADAVKGGASGVLVQRGVPRPALGEGVAIFEVENTLSALGALALFHRRRFDIPVVAVTGSNGKTTTKELVASILETAGPTLKTSGNLNNEVGVPLTLFGLNSSHRAAVVEMGMNHLGEIDRLTAMTEPDAGLITVVQPAHLEGVGTIEGVAQAKTELFFRLKPHQTAVINQDDARIVERSTQLRCRRLTFGRSAAAEVRLSSELLDGVKGQRLTVQTEGNAHSFLLPLLGRHNALNAVGAFALARAVGFSPDACCAGLSRATAYPQRLEMKRGADGLVVLDDCYNANPASMLAALETLASLSQERQSIAVLGDMLELGEAEDEGHQQVLEQASAQADRVFVLGQRMHRAAVKVARANVLVVDDVSQLKSSLGLVSPQKTVVLVKASRGMKLERVVALLLPDSAAGGH